MKTPGKRNGKIMLINSSLFFKYASSRMCKYMSIHTYTHTQTCTCPGDRVLGGAGTFAGVSRG